MDTKTRYKQLIKENNQMMSYLSDSYQRIANNYIKKARGYGVRSIDTEVKIKLVLEELTSYDEKNIDTNIAIPNMTDYIEQHIQELSKAPNLSFKIKEIIAVGILIILIAGYYVINCQFNKKRPLAAPQDVVITVIGDNQHFYLEWTHNPLAQNGYKVTIKNKETNEVIKTISIAKRVIDEKRQECNLTDIIYDSNITYVFEIKAQETQNYGESEIASYTYPNE
ncbi:MAG: hypothetical protein NC090_02055 [Anaeroplasma bactoclasticum]|nr:hypothetical protein [Anaeroplasma bactoclasticum]